MTFFLPLSPASSIWYNILSNRCQIFPVKLRQVNPYLLITKNYLIQHVLQFFLIQDTPKSAKAKAPAFLVSPRCSKDFFYLSPPGKYQTRVLCFIILWKMWEVIICVIITAPPFSPMHNLQFPPLYIFIMYIVFCSAYHNSLPLSKKYLLSWPT